MQQASSLPMYPTPTSIRHPPGSGVSRFAEPTKTTKTTEQLAVESHLASRQKEIDQSYTLPAKVAHWSMMTATTGAFLASIGFLILFSIGASHCTSTRVASGGLSTSEPGGMELISETVCALALDTRYWLLAMLGLNTIAFALALPSLGRAPECCELGVPVSGWRGVTLVLLAIGHLLSTCMLVGWLYTSDTPTRMLPILHCASITVLFSTLVLATSVATTFFLQHEQRAQGKARSRRNSLDLQQARDAIAAATQPNSRVGGGGSGRASPREGSISTRRGRFANAENVATAAAAAPATSPPALHTSALVGDLATGMSLTEIKQLVTQVIPCCTPQTIVDSTTGELIVLPCCSQAPILPSTAMPLGFTSPRRKDHGPVADLTDAAGVGPMASPLAQGGPPVPKHHLTLNTASPAHASDSADVRPPNTPLALHAKAGSPLASVLTHGPSAAMDAGCELCRDAFQAHQLVKILPECGHAMHSSCIVPYLKHRRDCPTCHTEVLRPENNRHAELSRLVMSSPSSSSNQEDAVLSIQEGVSLDSPDGVDVHHSPSTTVGDGPSPSSSPTSHLNVRNLTSPPSAVDVTAKPDLTVSALTSCGAGDAFNYSLDSVKLTPAHVEGQMTQRHQSHPPAAIRVGALSPVCSPVGRSPMATGSPTAPIQVQLDQSVKSE